MGSDKSFVKRWSEDLSFRRELTTASGWNSFKSFVPAYPANRVSFDLPRYRKIPKISPGAHIFQRPFLRGLFLEGLIRRSLCTEGNLRFKIDWASLILGRKFTVFLFFFKLIHLNHWSTLLLYEAYRYTITLLLYSNYLTILIYNTE